MNISRLSLLLAFAGFGLTACDNVDEGKRFEGPLDLEEVLAKSEKNVLIEDFTGQECPNCPKAANAVLDIQKQIGEGRVIAVAIHGGSFGVNEEDDPESGLSNATGRNYFNDWNIESQPSGIIDRAEGLKGGQDYELWQGSTLKRFLNNNILKANLHVINADFNQTTRELKIDIKVDGKSNVLANLQVWLTESKIKMFQKMPNQDYDLEYIHNHVFRASVNNPNGDRIEITADNEQVLSYKYKLKEYWKPENMAIVTFLHNEDDGVIQVIEVPVISSDNN